LLNRPWLAYNQLKQIKRKDIFKSFATIAFAGCVQAQTATNSDWTATTVTVQDRANPRANLATSSMTLNMSELINGVNSYSITTTTVTMKSASTWSTETGSMTEYMYCFSYTDTEEGATTPTTVYPCTYI